MGFYFSFISYLKTIPSGQYPEYTHSFGNFRDSGDVFQKKIDCLDFCIISCYITHNENTQFRNDGYDVRFLAGVYRVKNLTSARRFFCGSN